MADHDSNRPTDSPTDSKAPGHDLRWMSTPEAASYLGITPRTVYKLIDTDQLRAYRFGSVIRIRGNDLDTFIDGARIQLGTLSHLYPDTPDNDDDSGEMPPDETDETGTE
jgi:excisionase family DNA binding protein